MNKKGLSNYLAITFLVFGFVLGGCSANEADRYASKNFGAVGSEGIMGEGDYVYIQMLLGGNPSKQGMLNVAGKSLDRLNTMADLGKYSSDWPDLSADYQNVVDMMGRVYDLMYANAENYVPGQAMDRVVNGEDADPNAPTGEQATGEVDPYDIERLFGIAAVETVVPVEDGKVSGEGATKVVVTSELGKQLNDAAAFTLATAIGNIDNVDVYGMLEYLMLADAETILYPAFTGIKINGFEDEEHAAKTKKTVLGLIDLMHGMMPAMYNDILPLVNDEVPGLLADILNVLNIIDVEDLGIVANVVMKKLGGMALSEEDMEWDGVAEKIIAKITEWVVNLVLKLEMDDMFVGLDIKAMQPLLAHLLADEGLFMENVKVLLCELLDVEHATYNPDGQIPQSMGARTFLDHLIKRQGLIKYELDGKVYCAGESVSGWYWYETDAFGDWYYYYNAFGWKIYTCTPDGPIERHKTLYPVGGAKIYTATPSGPIEEGKTLYACMPIEEQEGAVKIEDPGLFDLYAPVAGLYDLTDAKSAENLWAAIEWIVDPECVAWEILGIDTDVTWPVKVSDILGMEADKCLVTLPFVQAMFRETGVKGQPGSLVEWGIKSLELEGDEPGKKFDDINNMKGLMGDVGDLMTDMKDADFSPSGEMYHFTLDLLQMVSSRARP